MSNKQWYEGLDYKDMTTEQQVEYKKAKWKVISDYMGVPTTSIDSLKLRTRAFLEETKKNSFWD